MSYPVDTGQFRDNRSTYCDFSSFVFWLGAAVYFTLVVRHAWYADDAFVTFRVVDNFINGYGLRWNVAERVQTYTNPLWMFACSVVYFFVRNMYFAPFLLSFISVIVTCLVLRRLPIDHWQALFLFSCFSLSEFFVDFSTSGLENPLTHLLAALFLTEWLRPQGTRITRLTLIASLAAVNRLDTLSFFALPVIFAAAANRALLTRRWALLASASPFLLWELFALWYYGAPLPNTYFAKMRSGVPLQEFAIQGFCYLLENFSRSPLMVLIIAAGTFVGWLDRGLRPLAAGVLLNLVYIVAIGGDFMTGRFLTLSFFVTASILAIRLPITSESRVFLCLLALLFLNGGRNVWNYPIPLEHVPARGVVNEKSHYLATTLINWNRSEPWKRHHFATAGVSLGAENRARIVELFNIGFSGFLAGPKVHIIDRLALSDPLLARLKPIPNSNWRIAHFARALPLGYLESLANGSNVIRAARVASLYNDIHLVTRGSLWSLHRLRAIISLLVDIVAPTEDPLPVLNTRLQHSVPEHTPWESPQAVVMDANGVRVNFSYTTHWTGIRIMADCNDRYELRLYSGEKTVHRSIAEPTFAAPCGLTSRRMLLPEDVARKGFDRIDVIPSDGDSLYSVAYLGND